MKIVLYKKFDANQAKPFLALYIAFYILSFLTINTYYLVFFEEHYRYYLWAVLSVAYLISIYSDIRYRPYLEMFVNMIALVFSILIFLQIVRDLGSFGTILGQLLAVFLALRSSMLFTRDDFFMQLTISLSIMLLCSIPSYESNYVVSLQAYFFCIVACLYLLSKTKQHESRRYGFFEARKIQKIFTTKTEMSMLVLFALAALIFSTIIYVSVPRPQGRNPRYGNDLQRIFGDRFTNYNPQGQNEEAVAVSPLAPRNETYVGFDENSFRITTGRQILQGEDANEVVMEVQMDYPNYMRAMVWDVYENGEWKRSDELEIETELKMSNNPMATRASDLPIFGLPIPPEIEIDELKANRVESDGKVFLKGASYSTLLFLPWQITRVTIDADDLVTNEASEVKLIPVLDSRNRVKIIRNYQFSSQVYLPSGMEKTYLRSSSDDPALEKYKYLSDSVLMDINGKNIRQMAEEIVQAVNAQTDYEKTVAIYNYLKSIGKYSLDPPFIPSEFDVISYFLLEVNPKYGHCEIFSSSMAVLLRSLDIPCRVSTGYTSGTYSFGRNSYLVRNKNAHAWVEVFFPEVGWLEFDPTPGTLYNEVADQVQTMVGTVSGLINDIYVYSPKQFYAKKIRPTINRVVSFYYFNVGKIADFLGQRLKTEFLMAFILTVVGIASLLVIFLQLRKPAIDESIYKRVSRIYYRNLADNLRKKGNGIAIGVTPSELIQITKSNYPSISDPVELFVLDFLELNYSREGKRRELFREMQTAYKYAIKTIKGIKRHTV